jgi:hypothetical protein
VAFGPPEMDPPCDRQFSVQCVTTGNGFARLCIGRRG